MLTVSFGRERWRAGSRCSATCNGPPASPEGEADVGQARGIERRKIFWDDKDRKVTEVGNQKSEVCFRGQKSEIGGQPSTQSYAEPGRSEVGCRSSVIRPMIIKSAKDLRVYKEVYALAMEIFEISKTWPPEEKYSLTDQIRRSSRSVCSNLREAWAKRRYEAHFISKLTDSDGENSETDTWLDFAKD